jgi:hypothetical protein
MLTHRQRSRLRRRTGSDLLHITLRERASFNIDSNLSGALNRPLLRPGGVIAIRASSFSVGSARRYTSVLCRVACPSQSDTFRTSRVACRVCMAQVCRCEGAHGAASTNRCGRPRLSACRSLGDLVRLVGHPIDGIAIRLLGVQRQPELLAHHPGQEAASDRKSLLDMQRGRDCRPGQPSFQVTGSTVSTHR